LAGNSGLQTVPGTNNLRGPLFGTATVLRWFAYLALMLCACGPRLSWSQTPSPLQEWQYPGGTILEKLYEPNLQDWRVVLGAALAAMPRYDGGLAYHVTPGPVIVILYKDIAFASVGEGLGVNLLHGEKYRAGVSIGYDLGREMSDDYAHLHGLGNIDAAPVVKVFGSYVISKSFPMVLRADVRRIVGGADGMLGDLEAFMPLPGSSKTFVMFADHVFQSPIHAKSVRCVRCSSGGLRVSGLRCAWRHHGIRTGVQRQSLRDRALADQCGSGVESSHR
jgi:hypothetical protein